MTGRPLILFLHVPKAGGNTLYQILWRQFRTRQLTLHVESGYDLAAAARQVPADLPLLRGHMPYGIHAHLPRPVRYFTFLRDPVDRLISYYYYVRRSPDNRHYGAIHDGRLSLAEFARSGLLPADALTRRLAGLHLDDPAFDADPDRFLALAQSNLQTIDVVGLTERFDESVLLLQRVFGWRQPFYDAANVTPGRPSRDGVAGETLALLAARCSRDQLLYAAAAERFAQQAAATGVDQRALRRFQRVNAGWRLLYRPYMSLRHGMARRPAATAPEDS